MEHAITEHAWSEHHQIDWETVDHASIGELRELSIKEALHPTNTRADRDVDLELPDCLVVTLKGPGEEATHTTTTLKMRHGFSSREPGGF